jgi:hypothetical protein
VIKIKLISNVKLISNKKNGNWFLWFTHNEKHYCIFWECSKPVWWIPKIDKSTTYIRFGWLLFSFGFGKHPKENKTKTLDKLFY